MDQCTCTAILFSRISSPSSTTWNSMSVHRCWSQYCSFIIKSGFQQKRDQQDWVQGGCWESDLFEGECLFLENMPGLVTACTFVSLSLKIGFGEGGGISILDDGFWWWWTSSDRKRTEGGYQGISSKSVITKPEETIHGYFYLFHRFDPTSQDPHTEGLWRGGFWEPLVQNKRFTRFLDKQNSIQYIWLSHWKKNNNKQGKTEDLGCIRWHLMRHQWV